MADGHDELLEIGCVGVSRTPQTLRSSEPMRNSNEGVALSLTIRDAQMPASHAKNAILRSSSRRDACAIGLFWQLEALIEAGHDPDTALSLMAKNRTESEPQAGQHCRIDTGRAKLKTERPIFFTFG